MIYLPRYWCALLVKDVVWKVSIFGVLLVCIPQLGLNEEIYSVSLHIQAEFEKTETRKTRNTDTFCTVWSSDY